MKKLFSIMLAVLMLAAVFTGCASSNPSNGETPQKVELSRGKIDGAVYTSEFLGFSFTRPETWVYSSDEEMAAAMNLGAELANMDIEKALEQSGTLYDMMVVDTVTRSNINITIDNLTKTFASSITGDQYIASVKQSMSNISAMKVEFNDETSTVKLGKYDYTRVVCNVSANGVNMTQVYYVRKVDKYMCNVIVTLVSGYSIADIEAMFK